MRIKKLKNFAVRLGVIIGVAALLAALGKGTFDTAYYAVIEKEWMRLTLVRDKLDVKMENSLAMFQMAVDGRDWLDMAEDQRAYKCWELLTHGFAAVLIFDEKSNLIYEQNNAAADIKNIVKPIIDSSDYAEMMNGRFIMRGIVRKENPADAAVVLIMPIIMQNMEYRGAALGCIQGSELMKIMADGTGESGYFFITDEADFFIYSSREYINSDTATLYEQAGQDDAIIRSPNNFLKSLFDDYLGEVYFDLPLVNAPWHVISAVPKQAILREIVLGMAEWWLILTGALMVILISIWQFYQQKKLLQAQSDLKIERMKMMMQISANMAHEIKNPLTSLKGFLQYYQGRMAKDDPKQAKFFSIMLDEADRIESLSSQFCMAARPENRTKREKIAVNALLEEVYILLKGEAERSAIKLSFSPCVDELFIYGNRQQLKQIFINLLNNAYDAVRASGKTEKKVRFAAEKMAAECFIEVTDNGIGMKKDALAHLGEAFYSTKEKGNGLGMMITKELIEQHKGKLAADSEYGKGTVFIVTLPLYNK